MHIKSKTTHTVDFTIKKLHVHVDKLTLTIKLCEEQTVFDLFKPLSSHFQVLKGVMPDKKCGYEMMKTYARGEDLIDLLYDSYASFLPDIKLVIHEPNRALQERLNDVFRDLKLSPSVSAVELAWDFYSDKCWLVQEFLEKHVFLKWSRTPPRKYKNTFYTNNLRKSVKGIRIYQRPLIQSKKDFVRLELELHQQKIKQLGLVFPLTPEQLVMDYTQFFEFRAMDEKKIIAGILREEVKRRGGIDPATLSHNVHPIRKMKAQLLMAHIRSFVGILADDGVMEATWFMKKKSFNMGKYRRHFIPILPLNNFINDEAQKQGFCL